MPDSNSDKLLLELVACDRCKNPFMMNKGDKLRMQENNQEIICENCIKLEIRKKQLELGVLNDVIESQKEIEASILEVKDKIDISKAEFNKQQFLEKIKKRSQALTKSIELLQRIDETNEEKYIDDYKKLFEKLKRDLD
ncbi:MAG: Trm112 family protein [Candidatus Thorarchaeota archaeon]